MRTRARRAPTFAAARSARGPGTGFTERGRPRRTRRYSRFFSRWSNPPTAYSSGAPHPSAESPRPVWPKTAAVITHNGVLVGGHTRFVGSPRDAAEGSSSTGLHPALGLTPFGGHSGQAACAV